MTAPKAPTVHELLLSGDVDRAKRLINQDMQLIRKKDDSGRLPIHWACSLGFNELVEFLLTNQAIVDSRDDANLTPLIIAASAGNLQIVRQLMAFGADVNSKNDGGHSALQYAASKNHHEIVGLLLRSGADPNITDNMLSTPLHRASSLGNNKTVLVLLTETTPVKIDVNAKDSTGSTPLHLACEENRVEEAKLLVNYGARLDVQNKEEKTPLDLATPGLTSILRNIESQNK